MTEAINVVHIPKNTLGMPLDLKGQRQNADELLGLHHSALSYAQLEDQLDAAQARNEALLFETCLRKIWIVKSTDQLVATDLMDQGVSSFKSQEAYKFLLEVICGLHSPVVGETEVFGQFKEQVVKKTSPKHSLFKVVSQLVTDAKDIRRQHLTHLGSQTYGSFCRRVVLDQNAVDMIGFGSFAQSILPWVSKEHIEGRIFVRDLQKHLGHQNEEGAPSKSKAVSFSKFKLQDIKTFAMSEPMCKSVLILCAPIAAQEVKAKGYEVVIDLRETATTDPIAHSQVITLQDVFAEIQKGSEHALNQKSLALAEASVRASRFNNSMMLRPFGWDDICA